MHHSNILCLLITIIAAVSCKSRFPRFLIFINSLMTVDLNCSCLSPLKNIIHYRFSWHWPRFFHLHSSGEEPFGTSFRSTSTNSSTSASTSSTVVAANGHISSAKRKGGKAFQQVFFSYILRFRTWFVWDERRRPSQTALRSLSSGLILFWFPRSLYGSLVILIFK